MPEEIKPVAVPPAAPAVPAAPPAVLTSFEFEKKAVKLSEKQSLTVEQIFAEVTQKDDALQWEETFLPSRGAYYGTGRSHVPTPDLPDGRVQVRPMGLDVEKIMSTPRFAQGGKSIDMMIQTCCRLPEGFNALDLLAGDRLFLIYYIRGITFGNQYEFILTCPNDDCRKPSNHEYDLNDLARTIRLPDQAVTQEPFPILLPYLSKKYGRELAVKARFMRGRDLQVLAQREQFRRRGVITRPHLPGDVPENDGPADDTIQQNLNLLIVEALGRTDPADVKAFISKLHSSDSAAIRSFLDDKAPGLDVEIVVRCPHCQQDVRTVLPITEGFFRPKSPGSPGT